MKKRFTEEQIIKILREGEAGNRVEVCRKHGITETTFYRWRKKYQGMTVDSIKEVKQLRAENARLTYPGIGGRDRSELTASKNVRQCCATAR